MDFKDYYQVLGVSRDATQDQITRAFRKLARECHPDLNKKADAEARFKEVGEAYEVLKDPEKRGRYDRYGAAWKHAEDEGTGAHPFGNVHFEQGPGGRAYAFGDQRYGSFFDVLEQMFGRRNAGPFRPSSPFVHSGNGICRSVDGEDHEAVLVLSLEEAYQGGKREVALTEPESGSTRRYKVTVPKGVTDGQRIRLAGQGSRGSEGGRAGDLYLRIQLRPHTHMRLEGRDLTTTIDIAPWQAALGGSARLKTLDETVALRIPPGSSSGRQIRLRGKGYPSGEGSGDLYVEIRIVVPEKLSKEEEHYKALEDAAQTVP
jgi:curved DNA-binding protein